MKYIVFSFVAFALFIGSLVIICVKQDILLVSTNYYEEDLKYEAKQHQKQNANELAEVPEVSLMGKHLIVTYSQMGKVESGYIQLMRPSNNQLDQQFTFNKSLGITHNFSLTSAAKGLYRVSIRWKMNSEDYFIEKTIVL